MCKLRKGVVYCVVLFVLSSLGISEIYAQITNVSADLKNSFSLFQTRQPQGDLNLQTYGQFYLVGLSGYAVNPKILQFNVQTSLSDFSSASKSPLMLQSLRSRNIGYYNVSATFLPNNSYPLTLYASRSDAVNTNSSDILTPGVEVFQTANEVETMGLRWSLARNTYTPQMEFTLERNRNRGGTSSFPVRQTNDQFSFGMSNSSDDGASQYSFQYKGLRFSDETFGLNRTNHEFQVYGNSNISEALDLFSNTTYGIRDRTTSRNSEIGGTFKQSSEIQHRLKLQNLENRFLGSTVNRNVTTGAAHETHIAFSERLRGTFGTQYSISQNEFGDTRSVNDRGQVQANAAYNDRFSFADITGNASTSLGFERFPTQGRKFVQQTQLNITAVSTSIQWFQLVLGEDFGFSSQYYFGDIVNNTVRLGVSTNVVPRSSVGLEVSRGDTRYLDFSLVSPRSITTVHGSITTQLTGTTSAQIQHAESWIRSYYLERTTRTGVAVMEAGFFRNLTFHFRGNTEFNSFTSLRTTQIEAAADYHFYAFAFSARYTLFAVAGIRTSGIALEVRRPFAFDFR